MYLSLFFFNDPATTEIYTLSLHDALPILPFGFDAEIHPGNYYVDVLGREYRCEETSSEEARFVLLGSPQFSKDRKSTRLNSSHSQISYAVFCLKKKKQPQ